MGWMDILLSSGDIAGKRWLGEVDAALTNNWSLGNWGWGEMGNIDAKSSWEGQW